MRKYDSIALIDYTRGEEAINAATHGAALALSVCIFARCVLPSAAAGDRVRTLCAALYCFGTTATFLCSALYHGVRPGYAKKVLRLADHCMIYFAVAGTATGCVPAVYDTVGLLPAVLMPVFAWGGALAGLALTFFSFEKTKAAQMTLYILTAAVCAVCGGGAYKTLPRGAFVAFAAGSLLLLAGAALYGAGRKKRYVHCVFHVFIVAGLTVYFLGISRYCYG